MSKTPEPGIPGRPPGAKKRGRPATYRKPVDTGQLEALARTHTEVAIATLVEVCKGAGNSMARISAANALLDRGYGKPATMSSEKKTPNTQIQIVFADEKPRPIVVDATEVEQKAIAQDIEEAPSDETGYTDAAD